MGKLAVKWGCAAQEWNPGSTQLLYSGLQHTWVTLVSLSSLKSRVVCMSTWGGHIALEYEIPSLQEFLERRHFLSTLVMLETSIQFFGHSWGFG
jgi:hypothetical protein